MYDRINGEFIRWIVSFRRRVRPRILELLDSTDGDVFVLSSRRELAAFLEALPPRRPKIAV